MKAFLDTQEKIATNLRKGTVSFTKGLIELKKTQKGKTHTRQIIENENSYSYEGKLPRI